MSSLTLKNKKTIALFQGGLGDIGDGFKKTINLLSKKSINMIDSNVFFDMKTFNVNRNTFLGIDNSEYLSMQNALIMEFNKKIANIVALANSNLDKAILVRTSLSESVDTISNHKIEYLGFDSIKDQAVKLVYIINAIKNIDSSVRVILIGHSQGGLINLEAATRVPDKIEKLISISTPYSPVSLGKKLISINSIISNFNMDIYSSIYENQKLAKKYEDRVEDLSTAKYYNYVKRRWEDLSKRPSLTIITGVSGQLISFLLGSGDTGLGDYTPITILKYPFDGLIGIAEQTAIDHASIIGLTNPKLACYTTKDYMHYICSTQTGLSFTCKKSCILPSFSLMATLVPIAFNEFIELVMCYFTGKNFNFNIDDYSVVVDIMNGILKKPISDSRNQAHYDVYASDYSHENLRYCDETIGRLIALLSA